MTTMLEKMATAIWEADPVNPPFDSLTPGRFSWNLAHDQARAALLAIREPAPEHVEIGMRALWAEQGLHEDHPGESEVAAVFPAIIDAILNEKPEA